jgi:hypothetical protein
MVTQFDRAGHGRTIAVFGASGHTVRIPVMWAADYGDVGQSRSEATLVVFLH